MDTFMHIFWVLLLETREEMQTQAKPSQAKVYLSQKVSLLDWDGLFQSKRIPLIGLLNIQKVSSHNKYFFPNSTSGFKKILLILSNTIS